MVLFGQSSGPVPPFDLGKLAAKGSLYITRPTLFVYTAERADLERTAGELFDVVGSGKVRIEVNPDLSPDGRHPGPSRSGGPQDHGIHDLVAMTARHAESCFT